MNSEKINPEKWKKLTLNEQMGHIGSEVFRVIGRHNLGDEKNKKENLLRALELIDLTISDKRWKSRLFEICRLREVLCDLFFGNNTYKVSTKFLKDYFLFFALLPTN